MDLYSPIFTRHAVRDFDSSALDQSTIDAILDLASQAGTIDGHRVGVALATANEVKGSSAPYHLLAFSRPDDAGWASAGYVLQKADLAIQAQGLGSHWVGLAKPKTKREDFAILLAFGPTSEPPRAADDFKRIDLAEIIDPAATGLSDQDQALAEAVRLAPSGMNDQPWRIQFGPGLVRLIHQPRGAMSMILAKKMDKISLGIAARHAAVTLAHQDRPATAVKAATAGGRFAIELAY
jgi:nitroreductase